MKYKDTKWTGGTPIDGEMLSANGIYTGRQVGTPMQGKGETEANADAYYTEHGITHFGTIMQDAEDDNAPNPLFEVFYDLNGAVGTVPASQIQSDFGASITLSAAPTITTYPEDNDSFKEWNTAPDGTGSTYAASGSFAPTQDTTLYAVYQKSA